jgi:rhamnosyltransferase
MANLVPDGDQPTVAVLLATYNGAAHCETQLTTLLWQAGVKAHIFVRDDGSSDATNAIVASCAERHPDRITIIDNRGIATGSATGNFFALLTQVDLARFDYVAFADQDDVWTPDKLARATGAMTAEAADGYSSNLIAHDMIANNVWMIDKAGRYAALDYLFQGASAGCTYVMTRRAAQLIASVMQKTPPLCRAASHDWITYAICRSHGLVWVRDPASEILYRQHGANDYGARRGWPDLIGKLRLTQSRWYRDHILWIRNVVKGTTEETSVFVRIERGGLRNRLWLIKMARHFRRSPWFVTQLRVAIALRMI